MSAVTELNDRHGIEGVAHFDEGRGDLPRLVVTTPAAEAELYVYGAHVTHFQPRGQQPILFMSERCLLEQGQPIRGGVPVCFPWFAVRDDDPAAPNHGFARTALWQVEAVTQSEDGDVTATLLLTANDASRTHWPHDFELRHRITIGSKLTMSLEVCNVVAGLFTYEQALHTYLAVGDVRQVKVHALEQTRYKCKVDGVMKDQGDGPVTISSETDRVYMNTAAACVLDDPSMQRRIGIEKSGSNNTVVWNPWNEKAASMADFGDDEWPSMICIETCNVADNAVTLAPGEVHTMTASVGIEEIFDF